MVASLAKSSCFILPGGPSRSMKYQVPCTKQKCTSTSVQLVEHSRKDAWARDPSLLFAASSLLFLLGLLAGPEAGFVKREKSPLPFSCHALGEPCSPGLTWLTVFFRGLMPLYLPIIPLSSTAHPLPLPRCQISLADMTLVNVPDPASSDVQLYLEMLKGPKLCFHQPAGLTVKLESFAPCNVPHLFQY